MGVCTGAISITNRPLILWLQSQKFSLQRVYLWRLLHPVPIIIFLTFLTFLECSYTILINKKKFGKNLRTFVSPLLHTQCLCTCCFGLETRVISKISTHPCYPRNFDDFYRNEAKKFDWCERHWCGSTYMVMRLSDVGS